MKVFVNAEGQPGTLPPSPQALLGLLLHHVRDQLLSGRWGGFKEATEAFDYIFATSNVQLDGLLGSDPRMVRLQPLARSVGRITWNTRRDDLRRWSRRLRVYPTGEAPEALGTIASTPNAPGRDDDDARLDLGPEAWIIFPPLRLRGRADLIEQTTDGELEIFEFKSGVLVDDNGLPLPRHVTQVRLYALAAEGVMPQRRVRIFLEGGERVPVPWDDNARRACVQELGEVLDRFPQGAVRSARDLAFPGVSCTGCQLRPVCPSYLDAAPAWWLNTANAPRSVPLDVWGRVRTFRFVHDLVALDLVDSAGRIVRIEGLDPERGVDRLKAGDEVYLFDLEPTEPTVFHGARIQPRNFHELPPDGGLVLERARALQVYEKDSNNG